MSFITDAGFEPAAARAALISARSVSSEAQRRQAVAEIQTAALIDIAESLSVIALEAGTAMGIVETAPAPEPEPTPFFVPGDRARLIESPRITGEIVKIGADQGEHYALVRWDEGGAESRVWLRLIEHAPNDPPPADLADRMVDVVRDELDDSDDDDDEIDVEIGVDFSPEKDPLEALREKTGGKKKGRKK